MTQLPILVLGATGKTGRRVIDRLAALGIPTRAGSRSAEPPFDWNDRSTWAPALEGAGAVYLSYFPDLAIPALTEEGHAGEVYEVTGPRLLTFAGAVREIAEASGREVRLQPVPMDDYVSDAPAEFGWLLRFLFTEVLDGRNAHVTDGVQRALGRPPRDFRDFARETWR